MNLSFRPGLFKVVTLCLLVLSLSASSYVGNVQQDQDFEAEWAQSVDPCFPVEKMKKTIRDSGRDPWFLECYPVRIEVTWDVTDTHERHSGFGTDRIKLKLHEMFVGYLELFYDPTKKDVVESIGINAPSPCCPGGVDCNLEDVAANILVCDSWGENCKRVNIIDPLLFEVTPPQDSFFGLNLDQLGNIQGGFGASRIQFRRDAPKKPYFPSPGTDLIQRSKMRITVTNQDPLTLEEVFKGLDEGEFTKVFKKHTETNLPYPGRPERKIMDITATVRFVFKEPERERWQVTVRGREQDALREPIWIKDPSSGSDKRLPVVVDFDWKLEAVLLFKKSKGKLVFEQGQVASLSIQPKLIFHAPDLYRCEFVNCPQAFEDSSYIGANLTGAVSGRDLKLKWPSIPSRACVLCTPRKSYLSKVRYRQEFGSEEFMKILSQENLVLKNGYSKQGKAADWLTYTVSLKKLD